MSRAEYDWLLRHRIRAILSLTETPLPSEWLSQDVRYLHLPVSDHAAPTPASIQRAVEFIQTSLQEQLPVLVHCAAGQGRTGTVLASFLVKTEGLDPQTAIRTIRRLRPGSLENRSQEAAVRAYAQTLGSAG